MPDFPEVGNPIISAALAASSAELCYQLCRPYRSRNYRRIVTSETADKLVGFEMSGPPSIEIAPARIEASPLSNEVRSSSGTAAVRASP